MLELPERRKRQQGRLALLSHLEVARAIERASHEGGAFVFGYLTGGPSPFQTADGSAAAPQLFFFGPLVMLIVVGALSAVLFHFGILKISDLKEYLAREGVPVRRT